MKSQLENRIEAVISNSFKKVKTLTQEKEKAKSRQNEVLEILTEKLKKQTEINERIEDINKETDNIYKEISRIKLKIPEKLNQHKIYSEEALKMEEQIQEANSNYDKNLSYINDKCKRNEEFRKESIKQSLDGIKVIQQENNKLRVHYELITRELQRLEVCF